MTIEIREEGEYIRVYISTYIYLSIPKIDLDVWLEYYKHRLKTSKKHYIDLWQTSINRNKKFSNRLENIWNYRGTTLTKESLAKVVELIEEEILNVEINEDYLKKKNVRELIRVLSRVVDNEQVAI